jgi:hypothetical protein
MSVRMRRVLFVLFLSAIVGVGAFIDAWQERGPPQVQSTAVSTSSAVTTGSAVRALENLSVKGRAPKTGYARKQFSDGWNKLANCDVRNFILNRDLTGVIVRSESDCTVLQGTLQDPYTGKTVQFVRSAEGSDDVQIDHVIAVSNAWQTGAQQLNYEQRNSFYNDPLNLLAVEGQANNQKGDADAASWLPPNKAYRCPYVARQIAVKAKYSLWVTEAEKWAMGDVLKSCPEQQLPLVQNP